MKKNILIGVTGGIAAYKTCDIVSRLKKEGFDIDVIMTKHAQEFVSPLTFQTLSGNKTVTDMFESPTRWDVEHIELAKKAELVLIAPATANIIAKLAYGIADDMLSTTVMATKAEVILAPAMNTAMYENPIVQENIKRLKERGYLFIDPASGLLACGDVGAGKMETPERIVDIVKMRAAHSEEWKGCKVVVTAGPTIEDLDPVRYLTNRSTGKMGYAIAKRAVCKGADVVLISGKTELEIPWGLTKFHSVRSAREMYEAVSKEFEGADILIKAAAVADFTPESRSEQKIKKKDETLKIEMVRTVDIALEMGRRKKDTQVIVGFAAETESVLEHATDKLKKKNMDFIVSNDLTKEGAGFASETNLVTLLFPDGERQSLDLMKKSDVADRILDAAGEMWKKKRMKSEGERRDV